MTHRDGEARVIGELLQRVLPKPRPVPIASAPITFDHEVVGLRVALPPVCRPPAAKACRRKRGRDRTRAHHHIGVIRHLIVQAVGRRFPCRIAGKVVHVDLCGYEAPARPSVFEVPDQLRLLRVDTEDGLSVSAEQRLGALNKARLLITMGMRFARESFDVGPQGILHALEQTADRLCRGASQPFGERAYTASGVLRASFRVATGFRVYQVFQGVRNGGIFFFRGGRPPPGRRTRPSAG